MNLRFFIFILFTLFGNIVFSQTKEIDSLKLALAKAKDDTIKINLLNLLGKASMNTSDFEKGLQYCNDAAAISQMLNFSRGLSKAYTTTSTIYYRQGNFSEALEKGEAALKISEKTGDQSGIAGICQNMGYYYESLGNYPLSLKMQYRSLKIHEALHDKHGVASNHNNIGIIYSLQKQYPDALKHLAIAAEIFQQLDDPFLNHPYNNMGAIYQEQGNYPAALEYRTKALKIREKLGDKYEIANSMESIGGIYFAQGRYKDALIQFEDANKIRIEIGDKFGLSSSYNSIGEVYIRLKQFADAREYINKSLAMDKESGSVLGKQINYASLATLDSATGNYKTAFENYKMSIQYRDSLINEENTKHLVQNQMQYDFDKKEDSLKQKQLITETKLQAQKKQKYFYWAGIFMLGLLSVFVYLNFRNQKRINKMANEAHTRQKTEMELQSQQAILSERLRISSELHDEVGATLSGIAMYSHLTKEQLKSNQTTEIEKSLNVMHQSSAQMVDKLSDIVWLINPEQDTLQKLVTRLEEYATDMAAIKNMQIKINVPDKIADINLPVESRRNIYLFCKEAINNAVKYSNATLLELTVKEVNGKLEFSVSDNGRGFDAVMVRRGNGLENMQKRADEIGAKLIVKSKENEGVSVSMQCFTLE
jgi:two-component system, NarL family, sensor histidine kinase UhpB